MTQARRHSVVEVCSSTFIGFVGSWIITYGVMSVSHDPAITATTTVTLCTVWSLVRGYAIRRHFARKGHA